jgi:hypothetical protein
MWTLLLTLWACDEAREDDPAPTPREICDDGADNDADGLVDCEDAACDAADACLETACADGQDNEQDGAVDCFDDDCWGTGDCRPIVRRTAGVIYADARRSRLVNACYGTANGTTLTSQFTSSAASTSVQVRDVRGTIRLGEAGPACGFSLYGATWGQRWASGEVTTRPASRARLALTYDCAFPLPEGALPETLALQNPWDPTAWRLVGRAGAGPAVVPAAEVAAWPDVYTPGNIRWTATPTAGEGGFAECRWTSLDEVGAGTADLIADPP